MNNIFFDKVYYDAPTIAQMIQQCILLLDPDVYQAAIKLYHFGANS